MSVMGKTEPTSCRQKGASRKSLREDVLRHNKDILKEREISMQSLLK